MHQRTTQNGFSRRGLRRRLDRPSELAPPTFMPHPLISDAPWMLTNHRVPYYRAGTANVFAICVFCFSLVGGSVVLLAILEDGEGEPAAIRIVAVTVSAFRLIEATGSLESTPAVILAAPSPSGNEVSQGNGKLRVR